MNPLPETLAHFRLLRRDDGRLHQLGSGAMGTTYKAIDTSLDRLAAIKLINPALTNDSRALARFLREARTAAMLRHPHVASVYFLGQQGEMHFYAMEFVEGEDLDRYTKAHGPLPPRVALRAVQQIASALAAAHERSLIHRDIKPANVMVTGLDGDNLILKLIDFGLAKALDRAESLTGSVFVGSPAYASPEQCERREVDHRSDLYSLGATLWHMIAGRPPFRGPTAKVMAEQIARTPPFEEIAKISPEIECVLRRMLAKDACDRPESAGDLIHEIAAAIDRMDAPTSGREALREHFSPGEPSPGFTLLDLLRRRRELDFSEATILFAGLARTLDAFAGTSPLSLRDVRIAFSPELLPTGASALLDEPPNAWPEFIMGIHLASSTGSTGISAPVIDAVSARGQTSRLVQFAALLQELLGGRPPTAREDARYVPVGALGGEGNNLLRQIFETRDERWTACADFWRALSAAVLPSAELAPPLPAAQVEPLLTISPALLSVAQIGRMLRLTPVPARERDLPRQEIRLVAREEFRLGRSREASDFVAWFLPRGPANDEKTRRIAKTQATFQFHNGEIFVRDGDGREPSVNGTWLDRRPVAMEPAARLRGPASLCLGGEYVLDVKPEPSTRLGSPQFGNVRSWAGTWRPTVEMRGSVLFAPQSCTCALREVVWLFSDTAFRLRNGWPEFGATASAATGRFLHAGGCFWLEQVRASPGRFRINRAALEPHECAPLATGQMIQFDGMTFKVEVVDR